MASWSSWMKLRLLGFVNEGNDGGGRTWFPLGIVLAICEKQVYHGARTWKRVAFISNLFSASALARRILHIEHSLTYSLNLSNGTAIICTQASAFSLFPIPPSGVPRKFPPTFVIMPLHVTTCASHLSPSFLSHSKIVLSKLSRCSSPNCSCVIWSKVSNPADRSAGRDGG